MCGIDGIKSFVVKTNFVENKLNINGLRFNRNQFCDYSMNGSFHKFFNNGLHNANDFHLSDLKNTYNTLYDNFQINPDFTIINGFEFGVNLKLTFEPNYILQSIIVHKSNAGEIKSYYKEFKYCNYSIKIYNKSEITKIEPFKSENILRLEINVNKMIFIKKQGIKIKVMSDFLDYYVMTQLENILLSTIEDLLIIDFSEEEISNLSNEEKILYLKYINPCYWTNLHINRRAYSNERKRCNNFIEKFSCSKLKSELKIEAKKKCEELKDFQKANLLPKAWDKITKSQLTCEDKITVSNIENKISKEDEITVFQNYQEKIISDKITVFQNEISEVISDKITIKINNDFVPIETSESVQSKHCKTCGKVITNPKPGQKFCSPKEVGETQAHKCRNKDSNPRNKTKYAVNKINLHQTLFNIIDFIRIDRKDYLIQEP